MTGDSISIVVMVLAIILVIPLLCRKMHIPSIVGFIAMGIVIGPSVLNLIPAGSTTLTTLGQLGMLYIMFQAGIEIDRNDFLQQRRRAVYFGLLTFLVPFCLGLMTGWAMGFDRLTIILLAAIYGSHTLMTYPIVTRYGIQKSPAVTIAVGGTSIAMVLSLGVLVVVKNNYLDVAAPWWFFTIRIVGFLIAVAWLMPKMLHWVFKRWQDPLLEFMIVMLALVVSSWLADLVDLEPILGAFLCGAALNGLVPKRSQLMDEINFLGNGIFVPMFLLSVGMMMDLSSFKSGGLVFSIAGLMIGTKLVGKWLASWIAQRGFRMSG
ncbi:MAG: cation:proton antiporter, partial [Paludibacteraceae bacterium]|nr:cation:proton antiporter [Paludibacteraceae bacterium]